MRLLRLSPQGSYFTVMKVLISSLALLALVGTGVAIRCFVCNSETDSACNESMQSDSPAMINAFGKECPMMENETMPFCRKVKEMMEIKTIVRMHRECGYKRREEYPDCYQKRSEDYVMEVCQCDEELCNDAPGLATPFAPLLAVVAFPLLARVM